MNRWISLMVSKHAFLTGVLLVNACGVVSCGNSDTPILSVKHVIKKFDNATRLQGQVSSKDKPIKAGRIKVTDSEGQLIVSTVLQDSNHYQVDIPANTDLPVILRFYPELNSPEAESLLAVVIDPTITHYDLSPLTTAIAKKAEALGGYTRANLVMAAESMVSVPDANKTSTGFRGDPTTQYGGWH